MVLMPDSLRLSPAAQSLLEKIRQDARTRHERNRKAAAKRGRVDFPLLPFECSWAYETQFTREYHRERRGN